MSSDLVLYRGEIVAIAGRRRFWLIETELDPATAWFVSVMCLRKREVDERRIEGRSRASWRRDGRA